MAMTKLWQPARMSAYACVSAGLRLALVLWLVSSVMPAFAQDTEARRINISVCGQLIMSVSDPGVFASPLERARHIESTVYRLIGRSDFDPHRLRIVETPLTCNIFYEDELVMRVTANDARALSYSTRDLATEVIRRLEKTAIDYRDETRPERLLFGVVISVFALVLLLCGLGKVGSLVLICNNKLESWLHRTFHFGDSDVLEDFIRLVLGLFVRTILFAGVVLAVAIYAYWVLDYFPWTRSYSQQITSETAGVLVAAALASGQYVPNLFVLMSIGYVAYVAAALSKFFFEQIGTGRLKVPDFEPDWAMPTDKLVRVLLIFLALVVAAPYFPGFETPAFKQLGIFLGLLLSLGSTGLIGNIIAGIGLTYNRAFRAGDRVKIGTHVGDVKAKTLLTTSLITPKQELVTLHNSQVAAAEIVNYSACARKGGVILHSSVTIGYDAPWRKVHALLIDAAKSCELFQADPPPFVLQRALNDFYVEYEVNAYTSNPDRMLEILSALNQAIQDKFNQAGIEITSPHFRSLRDGNRIAIPHEYVPPDYSPPSFRITDCAS